MEIRHASAEDLDAVAAAEAACFPPAEAASRQQLRRRLAVFPDHFWILEDGGRVIGFLNGFVTDLPDLTDEMYERAELHDENGRWQMIFGLGVLPEHRRRGCAGMLLRRAIADAKEQGRLGAVLTCKERLVPYYAKFGFRDEGISVSVHGGAVWHGMRLKF